MQASRNFLTRRHRISAFIGALVLLLLVFPLASRAERLRRPAHLFQFDVTGELVYIDASPDFNLDFNVYKGLAGEVKPLPLDNVRRESIGTVLISLTSGEKIWLPASGQIASRPYWLDRDGTKRPLSNLGVKPSTLYAFGLENLPVKTAPPAPLKLEEAFQDSDGNQILRLKKGARGDGYELYWAPARARTFYRLEQSGAQRDGRLQFAAPTRRDPYRLARIDFNAHGLTVSCNQGAQCFQQLNPVSESLIQLKLSAGELELLPPPDLRILDRVFKIDGSEIYIVVDGARLKSGEPYAVFIGEKGRLEKFPVKHHQSYRDSATLHIDLLDGRSLYSPDPYNGDAQALLYSANQPMQPRRLTLQKMNAQGVIDLGLPAERYDPLSLPTPVHPQSGCAVFLSPNP